MKGSWTGSLMKSVIPMLKRKGDATTPTNNKELIPFFKSIMHRPPLSFTEYITMHGIDIPAGANMSNLQLLCAEVSEDKLNNPTAPNNEWHNMNDDDMNVAEVMLGLAGSVVSL